MTLPEEWYKGIMEFSAEDSSDGSLMIAWIGGTAAKVADTLPDDQVSDVTSVLGSQSDYVCMRSSDQ